MKGKKEQEKPNSIFLNGLSWPLFHGMASLFLVLILGMQSSPLASYIDTRITAPIMFQLRHYLGKTPAISPKLKILALDDSTFSYLGGPRPSADQMKALLSHLGAKHPQAILIDSLLSDKPEEILANSSEMASSAPTFSGNFTSQFQLKYRASVDFSETAYRSSTYLRDVGSLADLNYQLDRRRENWNVYGHSPSYRQLIRSTGHITYNADGTISPFYVINDEVLVPHLALYAAHSIRLQRDGLWLEDRKVPLTSQGSVLINHRPPDEFYERSISLKSIIQRAELGTDEPLIEPGDIVLVLLAFATGNTDFHEGGPFGEIPGGLIIGSLISDLYQGTWLSRWETDIPLILFFGVAGIVLGINARVRSYWMSLIGIWIVCTATAVLIFAYGSIWIPWLLPLIAFSGTSLIHFAHVRIQDEMKLILIEKNYFKEKALRLEEMHKKSELETNLAVGRTVQKLLLPKALDGAFFGHEYEMMYRPVSNLSGDWFYAWDYSLAERRLLIGDVMGTGPSAAIPMAMIVGILKDCEEQRLSLEDSILRLNQRLFELFDQHVICSLSAVAIHRDGRIEIFNAGGPGWFLVGHKQADFLALKSSPIGLNSKVDLARFTVQLQDLQMLFTFTDGYFKTTKDLKRLVRMLRQQDTGPKSSRDIDLSLQKALQVTTPSDDQSLLCISRPKSVRGRGAA